MPERQIGYYLTREGKIPFREWMMSIKDRRLWSAIDSRLARLRFGHFGRCEPVGEGIFEIKIYYGPGYRIYFGNASQQIVLLLLRGEKSTQEKDILKARAYWIDYRRRKQ